MTVRIDRRTALLAGLGVAAAGTLSACGSGNSSTPGSAASGSAALDWSKKGPITYVQGKDTSGYVQPALDRWNADHPNEKVTLVELPEAADQQRQKMIDNATTNGSAGYDVLGLDVVWTAEFAANQYVVELPKDQFPTDGYLSSAVDSCTYFNKLYAFPSNSNGALLFYRKDLLDEVGAKPPTTWAEVASVGKQVKGKHPEIDILGGQFQKYEGLTCAAAEWINSAGGELIDSSGKPAVNSDPAYQGIKTLAGFFADGTIPKAATTWKEEESRQAFQDGKLLFLRNWPYVYALANKTDGSSQVAGKFDIVQIPGLKGAGVSTLGGLNTGISKTCKNPGTAREFLLWYNNAEQQKKMVLASSNAPTVEALYTDKDLVAEFPYLPPLQKAIAAGKPRPKAVKYGDVTLAIQDAMYNIISSPSTDPKAALDKLQDTLTNLTK